MILGSLIIGLEKIGILQPPDTPFSGFSINWVLQSLQEIEVHQYCKQESWSYDDCDEIASCKGVKRSLKIKMKHLEQQIGGLGLEKDAKH